MNDNHNMITVTMTFEQAQQLHSILTQAPLPFNISAPLIRMLENAATEAQRASAPDAPQGSAGMYARSATTGDDGRNDDEGVGTNDDDDTGTVVGIDREHVN